VVLHPERGRATADQHRAYRGMWAAGSWAEVLVGLWQGDLNSYPYLDPGWKPAPPIAQVTGQFTFLDPLKFAGPA
jgi:hypothetical protein